MNPDSSSSVSQSGARWKWLSGICTSALFICLKHCPTEEATTKRPCLLPQTVLVTFCLFEKKDYLNRLTLSREKRLCDREFGVTLVLLMSCSFCIFHERFAVIYSHCSCSIYGTRAAIRRCAFPNDITSHTFAASHHSTIKHHV